MMRKRKRDSSNPSRLRRFREIIRQFFFQFTGQYRYEMYQKMLFDNYTTMVQFAPTSSCSANDHFVAEIAQAIYSGNVVRCFVNGESVVITAMNGNVSVTKSPWYTRLGKVDSQGIRENRRN
jgi:hypothetical protein